MNCGPLELCLNLGDTLIRGHSAQVSFVADPATSAALGAADGVPKPVNWMHLKDVMGQFHGSGRDVLVVDGG